jgi:hypothetical protein
MNEMLKKVKKKHQINCKIGAFEKVDPTLDFSERKMRKMIQDV